MASYMYGSVDYLPWLNEDSITDCSRLKLTVQYVPFQASGFSILPANQAMSPGQYLQSPNGRFQLFLQHDGNVVLKDAGAVVWVADANQLFSTTILRKKMREPLQFVISNNGFLFDPARRRLWIAQSSFTTDKNAWYQNQMTLQDDGNLVIYNSVTGGLCWARFGFVPGAAPRKRKIKRWYSEKEHEIWVFDLW